MKVAVQCESPLLQRSLETFLASYLSTFKQCDVVVRDRVRDDGAASVLLISNEIEGALAKPFTRSQLMLALEQLVDTKKQVKEAVALSDELDSVFEACETAPETPAEGPDFAMLERRIEQLTREYQEKVMQTVRAFYEK